VNHVIVTVSCRRASINQRNKSSLIHTTFDTNAEGFTRAWKSP